MSIAVGLFDHIAEMNADAEFDAALLRQAGVALDHAVLHLDGATHRVDHAAVKAVLEGGAPINLHLFGLGTVHLMMRTLTEEQLLAPEHHAFRRAFETIDKIRTGEIRPWRCGLCRVDHSGLDALSVIAVIERALGEPTRDKPAVTVPVCQSRAGPRS